MDHENARPLTDDKLTVGGPPVDVRATLWEIAIAIGLFVLAAWLGGTERVKPAAVMHGVCAVSGSWAIRSIALLFNHHRRQQAAKRSSSILKLK